MDTASMGVMIPLIAVTLGLTLAIVSTIMKSRERIAALEQRHRERLAAIEKGVPLPPELAPDAEDAAPRKASRYLLRGLVCIGIGVGLVISAFTVMPEELLLPGAILIALGIALTLYYFLAGRRDEQPAKLPGSGPEAL